MRVRKLFWFSAFVICGTIATKLYGETIVDTLQYPAAGAPLRYAIPLKSSYEAYELEQRFIFANDNPNRYLGSIVLDLTQYSYPGSISVALYRDDIGSPGDFISALNGPSNPGRSLVTYSPVSPIDLAGLGTYSGFWVVVQGTGSAWVLHQVPAWGGDSDQVHRITWQAEYLNGTGIVDSWYGGTDIPNVSDGLNYALGMQVLAYPTVPEPSAIALACFGAAMLFRRC